MQTTQQQPMRETDCTEEDGGEREVNRRTRKPRARAERPGYSRVEGSTQEETLDGDEKWREGAVGNDIGEPGETTRDY